MKDRCRKVGKVNRLRDGVSRNRGLIPGRARDLSVLPKVENDSGTLPLGG